MDHTENVKFVFNKYADGYLEKYREVDKYIPSFRAFLNLIEKKDASLLEIGCGPGNITSFLLQQRPTLNILGIDIARNMIDLARSNNPSAQFRTMDCRNITDLNEKYDAILCGFCLPYLTKEEAIALIQDASALLHPGGVLYLSTMEGNYSDSGFESPSSGDGEQLFIHYHEEAYLTEAIKKSGFTIIETYHLDELGSGKNVISDLFMIVKKI